MTLGGRRVPVRRPRVRAADGSGELPVAAYEVFAGTDVLGAMAMQRMLGGLSARRYRVGLEPFGAAVERAASATSKSAVSRRFVAAAESALKDLLAADLSTVDLVAVMVDGVHYPVGRYTPGHDQPRDVRSSPTPLPLRRIRPTAR